MPTAKFLKLTVWNAPNSKSPAAWRKDRLTFLTADFILVNTKVGLLMPIKNRDVRKIGTWLLLMVFVFVAIILPLLSTDAPDGVTTVTFALILILEILFALSLNPLPGICAAYRFGISPRSPPIC